jgi:hypothetical protein
MADSAAWDGPTGSRWDELQERLDAWTDSIDWTRLKNDEAAYLPWAFQALDRIAAHARLLSPADLAVLEADRCAHAKRPDKPAVSWVPRYDAWKIVCRNSARVAAATRDALAELRALGIAAEDAGLAVVAQGVICDHEKTDHLAGPWLRQGHPFPRTVHWLSFDNYTLPRTPQWPS